MGFKEIATADIDNVFFQDDEFAETAIIDGKSVPIIQDNDKLNRNSEIYAQGLAEGEQLIFIKGKDLRRLPQPGERIVINEKQWYIKHALSNAGVFEIRIGRKLRYD
jgi:hypothetical protein